VVLITRHRVIIWYLNSPSYSHHQSQGHHLILLNSIHTLLFYIQVSIIPKNYSHSCHTEFSTNKLPHPLILQAFMINVLYPETSDCLSNLHAFRLIDFWCFNTTFSKISAISWRPVLVVEEAGVPGENHLPWASNW
jgi:hypothetical protein